MKRLTPEQLKADKLALDNYWQRAQSYIQNNASRKRAELKELFN